MGLTGVNGCGVPGLEPGTFAVALGLVCFVFFVSEMPDPPARCATGAFRASRWNTMRANAHMKE